MAKYLIVGDVDQIQSYVFSSSRLRAIRGASALLEVTVKEFVEQEKKKGAKFLRWRGGQIVAVLDVDEKGEADEFCNRLEAVVRGKSGGTASITTVHVEYSGTGFCDKLKEAFREIHSEKDSRQHFGIESSALLTGPYYHRCNLLPTQPAQCYYKVVEEIGEEEEWYLSEAAKARLDMFTDKGKREKIGFEVELLKKLIPTDPDYQLPYQPDDLWEEEEGKYMGFIAADGNSIGQMLEVIGEESLYEKFSNELYDLVLDTISEAAKSTKIPEKHFKKTKISKRRSSQKLREYKYFPLIPVIIAGDDQSLIVRSEDALQFVVELCRNFVELSKNCSAIQQVINLFCRDSDYRAAARQLFSNRFDDGAPKPDTDKSWKDPQPLTLSVGVAIAKYKFPISAYRRLASELRDEAKKALRKPLDDGAPQGGMIDFAVITTATVQSLKDLRLRYWIDRETHLSMRPYTLENFQKLQELARLLKSFPRSKRKFLYTQLFAGHAFGQTAYQFVMAREREESGKIIFDAMEGFGCEYGYAFRSTSSSDEKETQLIDALELAELMEKED